jgi:phosphate starvation-inducible protein PhoH and related proteins
LKTESQTLPSTSKTDSLSEETATLEFENARTLQDHYAGEEALLRHLEELLDVHVTTRDGWLKISGSASGVSKTKALFAELGRLLASGSAIGRHEFLYALEKYAQQKSAAHKESGLEGLYSERIQCSARKPPVIPKTEGQRDYLRAIDAHDITFGLGPAGTGKTYLAVAKAVASLKSEKVNKIILTRPAVEAGEALGFLPGELEEKILPYLRPLYDALHDMLEPEEIQRAIDKNIIEIAPLAYMRGRTLHKAFIILDEAQNTTTEQMFMFLTRIGVGSKCVVTGDGTQIDLPRNKPSGLLEAIEALKGTEGIAFHHFQEVDVVRHPLVRAIIAAYRDHRGARESRF